MLHNTEAHPRSPVIHVLYPVNGPGNGGCVLRVTGLTELNPGRPCLRFPVTNWACRVPGSRTPWLLLPKQAYFRYTSTRYFSSKFWRRDSLHTLVHTSLFPSESQTMNDSP